jgi:hypothetical protein
MGDFFEQDERVRFLLKHGMYSCVALISFGVPSLLGEVFFSGVAIDILHGIDVLGVIAVFSRLLYELIIELWRDLLYDKTLLMGL